MPNVEKAFSRHLEMAKVVNLRQITIGEPAPTGAPPKVASVLEPGNSSP